MKRIWILLASTILAIVSIPETGWTQAENETTIVSTRILPDSLKANINSIWIDGNGDILLATAHKGLLRSTDNGKSWNQILNVQDGWAYFSYAVVREPKTNSLLLGTAIGIFRSSDDGRSWILVWNERDPIVTSFLIQKDGSIFASSSNGVARSEDGGITWQLVFDYINTPYSVSSLTANRKTGTIFAGTVGDTTRTVIQSDDKGASWKNAGDGLGGHKIWSLASDDSGILYAGTATEGLYRSTNNGENWTKVPGIGEKKKEAREILVIRPDLVFVGFGGSGAEDDGVFKYDGTSWTQVVPDSVYSIMSLAVKGKSLLVGTTNYLYRVDGVIDTPTPVEETPSVPSSFRLEQNYPNPFNPRTTIEFSLPKRSNVSITIWNAIGQRIETLVDGEIEAGAHRIVWNAGSIPSGVYFYRLNAGAFTETKRMLLVK